MAEVLWADYAYPGVDLTGYAGVVRYLNKRNGSRSAYDLTAAEVAEHHAAGRPVALFWQDGASSAGLGRERGLDDARRAGEEADLIGVPSHVPIHYAVDDGTLTGPMVAPYFQAILERSTRPVGAYGSAAVCDYLAAELGIRWLIQTSSWSAGKVSAAAWLLQRDHNIVSGTSKVDVDPLLLDLPGAAWQPPGGVMAKWPTYDQLVAVGNAVARKTGTTFRIYSGASGRCRCCSGAHNPNGPFIRPLGPYIGVTRHITGGGLGNRTPEQYARDILISDPAVPFKCQWMVSPGGKELWLLGVGRANHMLNMSRAAYNALVNESLSLSEFCQNLRGSDLTGSTHTIGIEQVAASAPDAAQANVTDVLCAELCKIPAGWNGTDVIGHGEGASDRGPGDPNEHMGGVRTRSRNYVAGGTPPPPAGGDAFMADANVVSMTEGVYERIAWWVLWNYNLPWVDPQTQKTDNPAHPTTTVAATTAWVEEFTRRWSQEAKNQTIDALTAALGPAALKSAIQAAIAGSGLDVDEAELARQIIAQLSAGPAGAPAPEARELAASLPAAEDQPQGHAPVQDAPADGPAPRSTEAEADAYEKDQQAKLAASLQRTLEDAGHDTAEAEELAVRAVSDAAASPAE